MSAKESRGPSVGTHTKPSGHGRRGLPARRPSRIVGSSETAVRFARSPVAQLVERLTVNQDVAGSSPARGANYYSTSAMPRRSRQALALTDPLSGSGHDSAELTRSHAWATFALPIRPAQFTGGSAMKCPRCQHENPPQAKFCLECGVRVALTCTKCCSELPAGAKFCLGCEEPVASQEIAEPRITSHGSYKPQRFAT